MRLALITAATATLAACAIPVLGGPSATTATSVLVAADAASSLAVGERVTMAATTHPVAANTGQDPRIVLDLRHGDGRTMSFTEANHAPTHVMAQAPGGPLAQVMGLFGEEQPTLYLAQREDGRGEPFICGRDGGPVALGVYRAADGAVRIVGLKQEIAFETRPDGSIAALPYSPDLVCARLSFRQE